MCKLVTTMTRVYDHVIPFRHIVKLSRVNLEREWRRVGDYRHRTSNTRLRIVIFIVRSSIYYGKDNATRWLISHVKNGEQSIIILPQLRMTVPRTSLYNCT